MSRVSQNLYGKFPDDPRFPPGHGHLVQYYEGKPIESEFLVYRKKVHRIVPDPYTPYQDTFCGIRFGLDKLDKLPIYEDDSVFEYESGSQWCPICMKDYLDRQEKKT